MTMRKAAGSFPIPRHRVHETTIVARSRFVTTILRADSVDAARKLLREVRAEFPDASHHVYAFRIGHGNSVTEGMSDDGEPTGTAGPPVLAVLRGTDVGDVLVVVTRYFGGTKLGTGGLVRAYGEAARHGLARLETELRIPRQSIGIEIAYSLYNRVKSMVEDCGGEISGTEFTDLVTIYAAMPCEVLDEFAGELRELSAGRSEIIVLD